VSDSGTGETDWCGDCDAIRAAQAFEVGYRRWVKSRKKIRKNPQERVDARQRSAYRVHRFETAFRTIFMSAAQQRPLSSRSHPFFSAVASGWLLPFLALVPITRSS
jgi:hypothetical protein